MSKCKRKEKCINCNKISNKMKNIPNKSRYHKIKLKNIKSKSSALTCKDDFRPAGLRVSYNVKVKKVY